MKCHIQIFRNHCWQTAALFEPDPDTLDLGIAGSCRLNYDFDYVLNNQANREAELVPGLDVGFELFRFKQWPGFIVDLLPGGAGRKAWVKKLLANRDGPHMDWHMLTKATGNPPGNLRIAEAVLAPPPNHFKIGFPRRDIIEQRERFLDYAEERGAHVAGASSVQGEAPKYLLTEDLNGMFHAEGVLSDEKTEKFWLVKFARGEQSNPLNQQVLSNEAPYLEVARIFGIRVGEPLNYENRALFIPRFDRRVQDGRVDRFALHSLYSIANIPGFGSAVKQDIFYKALSQVTSNPAVELREYLLRDILNLALRNTDNHGRNTAVIRHQGHIELSPLFDFAPMFLDPEGIGRVSRWQDERPGDQPDWARICKRHQAIIDPAATSSWLVGLSKQVKQLPGIMHSCGVDRDIIDRLGNWIVEVAKGLKKAQPEA